jgi:lipid-binding SYLF domain-containing protein
MPFRQFIQIFTILFLFIALAIAPVHAGIKEREKIEQAITTLDEIMANPEKGVPPALIKSAEAIAIIPNVIKAGIIIAGRFGRGVMLVRNESGDWGHPIFMSIGGGSLGFQIGAESTDVILVFKDKSATEKIFRGKMTLGADAAVAAGPVGSRAETSTDQAYRARVLSYSRSSGLFAGVSLQGFALSVDDDWNRDYYDKPVNARDLVTGEGGVPESGTRLKETLNSYAK